MTFRKAAWLNPLCCARQFDASSDDGLGVSVIVTADFPSGVVVEQVYSFATRGVRHAIVRTVALMSSPHVLGEARISGYAESGCMPKSTRMQVMASHGEHCQWPRSPKARRATQNAAVEEAGCDPTPLWGLRCQHILTSANR